MHIAHHQRYCFFFLRRLSAPHRIVVRVYPLKAQNAKMSPPRREIRVGDFANRCNSHTSIIEAPKTEAGFEQTRAHTVRTASNLKTRFFARFWLVFALAVRSSFARL
jgi:hypothetical protein